YLEHLKPEYIRYYLSTKLNDRIEDLDINFDDFMQRVNADLVGKFINIASRCASFLHKYFEGKCSDKLADVKLFETFSHANSSIAEKYEKREFSQAIRQIMALADLANQYIDEKKPWSAIKETGREKEVHDICTMGINLFRILMIYLKPVLPEIAEKAEQFLNVAPLMWSDSEKPLLHHTLNPFVPLAQRLEKTQIDALKAAAVENIK